MELQVVRSKVDSPLWLNELTSKYKRDAREQEIRKAEDKQKDRLELINEITRKLGKQDPKVETTEIEKPTTTEDKVDQKAILDVIKEIADTLSDHAEILEDLSDRIERLEQNKATSQGAVKREKISQFDKEALEKRFELYGLTGEIRKVRPYQIIGGKLIEKP